MIDEAGRVPARKYPRMNAEFVLAYRRRGADGSPGPIRLARTRTLGLGGLMFEDEELVPPGEALAIEIVLGDRRIIAEGRVVYADPVEPLGHRMGIEFSEISEDDREFLLNCYLQREYRIPAE